MAAITEEFTQLFFFSFGLWVYKSMVEDQPSTCIMSWREQRGQKIPKTSKKIKTKDALKPRKSHRAGQNSCSWTLKLLWRVKINRLTGWVNALNTPFNTGKQFWILKRWQHNRWFWKWPLLSPPPSLGPPLVFIRLNKTAVTWLQALDAKSRRWICDVSARTTHVQVVSPYFQSCLWSSFDGPDSPLSAGKSCIAPPPTPQ